MGRGLSIVAIFVLIFKVIGFLGVVFFWWVISCWRGGAVNARGGVQQKLIVGKEVRG